MATDDQQVLVTGTASAPTHFTIPGNGQIQPKAIFAHFNGASAATAFVPALKVISDGGETVAICPCPTTVAAAGSADVSWFPHVAVAEGAGTPGSGVTLEQFFYDTSTASVSSSTVLASGVEYLITVQGTYSLWNVALDTGTPNADAMFPGSVAGRVSTQVGLDPDTIFAYPSAVYPGPLGHASIFELNLGSGFVYVAPVGGPFATPQTNYLYRYQVTGAGATLGVRVRDNPFTDNYGKLQVTIEGVSGGSSGGGGGGSLLPPTSVSSALLRAVSGVPTWQAQPSITEADLSLSNVTTDDVSTTKHGFAPKAPNDATKFLDGTGAYSVPSTSGGITDLTSTGSTITVTSSTGPTANVDLPATGVTAGSYGSSTQVASIAVDARGRLTSASNVSISGISGTGLVKLFDSTLGAAAASIDTGAGGVAAGHDALVVVLMIQSASAAAQRVATMRFNNDSGANYDRQFAGGGNTSSSVNALAAQTGCTFLIHGNAGSTSYPGVATFVIPSYDQTTFWKVLTGHIGVIDATVGNDFVTVEVQGWRSTAAISRISVQDNGGGNLSAGSRLTIYGTQ